MKKGDQIKKVEHLSADTQVARNFESLESANRWISSISIPVKAKPSPEFPGTYHVVLKEDYDLITRAKVMWVVDKEVSILDLETGLYKIVDMDNWEVEIEGTPAYQSTVENMSEQQLRDSLDGLRSQRRTAPRVSIRAKAPRTSRVKEDPMMKVLNGLDPEKKKELMIKLGLV